MSLSASQYGTHTRYDHLTAKSPKKNKPFPRLRFGKQQGENSWANLHLETENSKGTPNKTKTINSPTTDLTNETEDESTIKTTQEIYEVGDKQKILDSICEYISITRTGIKL